mgnify:FL=1
MIIPVYNVEKYLRRCLDSVIAQTYQNFEIICVDDGSIDDSGKICDQYAVRDARIKVIHQENQGPSAARNRGLDAAEGEYIAFVDSDDYILEDMYKKMLDKLLNYNVDLCVCQWQYEFSDGRQVVKKKNIDPTIYGCKTSLEFARFLYRGNYENSVVVAVWNKLYRRALLDKIRFEGRIHEDEAFSGRIMAKNISVYVMEDQFYVYAQNGDSLTNKSFSANKFFFLDALAERRELFKSDAFIRQETELLYCNMYIEYCLRARKDGVAVSHPERYRQIFRKMFSSLRREGKVNIKFRLRMMLFSFSPSLYRFITKQ